MKEYKLEFGFSRPFSVGIVNDYCVRYPSVNFLVEVPSTRGISSQMLRQLNPKVKIRVAGGYTKERIENCSRYRSDNGSYYTTAVIYSRNELIKIIEVIEEIEKGINKNWSSLQKLVYVYDKIKNTVMYDPKFENKSSSQIRSLRGLLTKETVCAGFALILKEILDRLGIDCAYVESYKHAWNIVQIEGKLYPLDLTYDNSLFRSGRYNSFDHFGYDLEEFSKTHIPLPWEPIQDYEKNLSTFNRTAIISIIHELNKERDYTTTTYYGTRHDKSKFIVSQVGDSLILGTRYYRYYYAEMGFNGRYQNPIILYSDTNVTNFINARKFGQAIPEGYEEAIDEVLFSYNNIADSLLRHTYYIGKVRKTTEDDTIKLVKNYQEIEKPKEKCNLFTYATKRLIRSDGSSFVIQRMNEHSFMIDECPINRFDIFELIQEDGAPFVKRNTVFSEMDLIYDNHKGLVNDFLSRQRIDQKMKKTGGYLGYYDENGIKRSNPNLVRYFSPDRRIDIDYRVSNNGRK